MKYVAIVILVFSLTHTTANAKAPTPAVHVISTKSDIFYFKVNRLFLGGVIEVYSEGNLIKTDTIKHLRNVVDFYLQSIGTYEIKITKGGRQEEFEYQVHEPADILKTKVMVVGHPGR